MQIERIAAIGAALVTLGSCAGPREEPVAAVPIAAAGAVVTIASRSALTVTGQPLGVPHGDWEAVISVSDLPPGGVLPMHKHPWPRYVYIDRGRIRVRYEALGTAREFGPGEGIVEAIDQWHEGEAIGAEPLRLIVFDQLPRGQTNVIRR